MLRAENNKLHAVCFYISLYYSAIDGNINHSYEQIDHGLKQRGNIKCANITLISLYICACVNDIKKVNWRDVIEYKKYVSHLAFASRISSVDGGM